MLLERRDKNKTSIMSKLVRFITKSVQVFSCPRMRFSEIPMKLASLLQHPDPIIINHMIR